MEKEQFDVIPWAYGLFSGFIGGGASAVVSGVAVSMLDSKDFAFGSLKFFELVLTIFFTHGAMSAFMYLKQSPLPPMTTTTTTVQTIEHKENPPQTVVTKVEETTVAKKDS